MTLFISLNVFHESISSNNHRSLDFLFSCSCHQLGVACTSHSIHDSSIANNCILPHFNVATSPVTVRFVLATNCLHISPIPTGRNPVFFAMETNLHSINPICSSQGKSHSKVILWICQWRPAVYQWIIPYTGSNYGVIESIPLLSMILLVIWLRPWTESLCIWLLDVGMGGCNILAGPSLWVSWTLDYWTSVYLWLSFLGFVQLCWCQQSTWPHSIANITTTVIFPCNNNQLKISQLILSHMLIYWRRKCILWGPYPW